MFVLCSHVKRGEHYFAVDFLSLFSDEFVVKLPNKPARTAYIKL